MLNNVVHLHQRAVVNILPILPEFVDDVIDQALPLIRKGQKRAERNIGLDDIIDDLKEGGSLLWMIYLDNELTAIITTAIVNHPRRSNFKIEFIGGSRMDEWVDDALAIFTRMATDGGCGAIEADGRKGFDKLCGKFNFQPIFTHFEMELN